MSGAFHIVVPRLLTFLHLHIVLPNQRAMLSTPRGCNLGTYPWSGNPMFVSDPYLGCERSVLTSLSSTYTCDRSTQCIHFAAGFQSFMFFCGPHIQEHQHGLNHCWTTLVTSETQSPSNPTLFRLGALRASYFLSKFHSDLGSPSPQHSASPST